MGYSLWTMTVSLLMLVAAVSCTKSLEVSQVPGLKTVQPLNSNPGHNPQKRSTFIIPEDNDGDVLYEADDGANSQFLGDNTDKRGSLFRFGKRQGSLFRFGKRQGSLFRFGKRGSLFRFGKRQGSLFRFGKRGGSIFRFGRGSYAGHPAENIEDKRTLFRFGKRSDLDLLGQSLNPENNINSPSYLEDLSSKRATDSFHWGNAYDQE